MEQLADVVGFAEGITQQRRYQPEEVHAEQHNSQKAEHRGDDRRPARHGEHGAVALEQPQYLEVLEHAEQQRAQRNPDERKADVARCAWIACAAAL